MYNPPKNTQIIPDPPNLSDPSNLSNPSSQLNTTVPNPPVDLLKDIPLYSQTDKSDFPLPPDSSQTYYPSVMISNMFNRSRAKLPTPPNHEVAHTDNGVAYLKDNLNPPSNNKVSFWITIKEIATEYGVGVYLYFDFIKFLIMANSIFFLIGMVSFGYHFSDKKDRLSSSYGSSSNGNENGNGNENESKLRELFISSYGSDIYLVWVVMSIITILGWILLILFYQYHITKEFKKISDDDNDYEDRYQDDDQIPGDRFYIAGRRLFVVIVFFIMLLVSGIGTYLLTILQDDQDNSTMGAAITSIFIMAINFSWKKLCKGLTIFEAHATWTDFRNYNTLKLFIFKITNVIILYIAKSIALKEKKICVLTAIGEQFFFLLIIDMTLGNISEICIPLVRSWLKKNNKLPSTGDHRPEFDISEEYLQILYRQFIVYMGGFIFPGIYLLSVVMNILEIYVDKYRLTQICQPPHRLRGSMKSYLDKFLWIMAISSILTYPYGGVWILSGSSPDLDNCEIYD